jgi:hypothetical protein
MEVSGSDFSNRRWLPLVVFVLVSLVLYLPVLHNSFASDDFKSVYRAGVNRSLSTPGFFRPFSDFSILITYAAVGPDTFYYHISNVLLHGCSAFLLFMLALKFPFVDEEGDRRTFAWLSAILFVTYPFHNESITWIVGRGSVIATFFALASMLFFVSELRPAYKYVATGCLFFLGLLAYESILLLPVILLMIFRHSAGSKMKVSTWLLVFGIALLVYFSARYYRAGVIIGDYGYGTFSFAFGKYVSNFFKVTGRMLVPPSNNSIVQIVAFSLLAVLYLSTWFTGAEKFSGMIKKRRDELDILFCLLVSLIVPVTFGLSTRTSEGERLLYFPSVFICLFFAYLIFKSPARKIVKRPIITALILFNICFIEINNSYWVKASGATKSAIMQIGDLAGSDKEIVLINVPGEYRGAYILRNALREAMLLNNIDTQKVQVANYLNNAEYNSLPGKILPVQNSDTLYFGRSVTMRLRRLTISNYDKPNEPVNYIEMRDSTEIWFWDKHRFIRYD